MTHTPLDPSSPTPSHVDQWISYRCGLIAARIGNFVAPIYGQGFQMSMPTWRALAVIARFGPLSASELAQHTSSNASKVSRAIDTLVQEKLLTRHKDPQDTRRAVLQLTPRGRDVYAQIERSVRRVEQLVVDCLSEREWLSLMAMLDKVDRQIETHLLSRSWEDFTQP